MNEINSIYYDGFEGEPEIQFIKVSCNEKQSILSIWDGYFNDIMEQFKPSDSGWMGLSYYYHLYIGWYEESPWEIPNLSEALEQFNNLNKSNFRFQKSLEVLLEICKLLNLAVEQNESVWIAYE